MNGIQLTTVGNVTKDVELRFTPNGQPVATFTVAVTPRTKRGDTWVDGETTFLDCQVWGLPAENVAETLIRGTRVIVSGTLKTERWEDREGQARERVRLTVDEVGPSLRYASAKVTKTDRLAGGLPSATPAAAPEADPWATARGTITEQLGGREVRPSEDPPF